VTRDDVAAVIAAILEDEPRSSGTVLYVGGGELPIADALAGALS
jgi:hypothetical protein